MGRWVGAVQWIAHVNHHIIRSVGFNQIKYKGELISIAKGYKIKLSGGGWVQMKGNKVTVGIRGEEVDFVAYGYFFNLYARSNVAPRKLSGICSHQLVHSYDFTHPVKAHQVKIHEKPCPKRNKFEISCRRRNLKGGAFDNCVFDLCAGAPKKLTFKIQKEIKKEKKTKIKKTLKRTPLLPKK